MRRRLFTLCSALSLLLCAAVVVLYARSIRIHDRVSLVRKATSGGGRWWTVAKYEVHPTKGNLIFMRTDGWYLPAADLPERGPPRVQDLDWVSPPDDGPAWTSEGNHQLNVTPHTYSAGGAAAERWARRTWRLDDEYPILLFLILPSVWAGRRLRARARPQPGRCAVCGYDLRASPDRCPECGTEAPSPPPT